MKKLAIPFLFSFLAACSSPEVTHSEISLEKYEKLCLSKDPLYYDENCEGKQVIFDVFVIKREGDVLTVSSKDPLTEDPNRPFSLLDNREDYYFELNLEKSFPLGLLKGKKVRIKGVVGSSKGFFSEPEIDYVVVDSFLELTEYEEEIRKKVKEIAKLERDFIQGAKDYQVAYQEERAKDNIEMMAYAEQNHQKLLSAGAQLKVIPNAGPNMAMFIYKMPSGKVVTCLRGIQSDIFVYNCNGL